MSSCGVNEIYGKIRKCEDDDVWWNEMSVSIIMLCVVRSEQKKTIVQSRIKHSLANLIK